METPIDAKTPTLRVYSRTLAQPGVLPYELGPLGSSCVISQV
jgi:hypothetical protein